MIFNMLILIGYLCEISGANFRPLPVPRLAVIVVVAASLLAGPMGNDVYSLPAWFIR